MLEKNKEFGGFVQQFIAIKESVENKVKNMIIRDVSMSYLYVSHPIFVKLYETVCGFTGTIGSRDDKDILSKQYGLTTKKVPRHLPNQRVEFPMILCKSIKERNHKILTEVLHFHKKGNPVLVIFQSLTEIDEVEELLLSNGIKLINIFNGKDDFIEPDEIAGNKGAVSLGTNICGRGTNINSKGNSLHVIVSYFSSNVRVMNQAFGRTARQGQKGTYRVICLESQFFSPTYIISEIGNVINEFQYKNHYQQQYVEHFTKKAKWIFQHYLTKQEIPSEYIRELRSIKINVNRILAYKYKFPLCMSQETFLTIQEQKILSIFNCPNSPYTWRLFQRYIRELILESWSLMINDLDRKYLDDVKSEAYKNELRERKNNLIKILDEYFPINCKIVPTFMHIVRKVRSKYENQIFDKKKTFLLESKSPFFFTVHAGFKPFSLISKSGSRILFNNFKNTNYIKDPELKYEQRCIKNKFSIISITRKIDDIFNYIFQEVNKIIGSRTFLRLYLRRTLAGCEFGVCLNLDLENNDDDFAKNNPYCIVDKDPLLLFTIFVRSLVPILAIILISLLVYLAVIGKRIAKWFTFPSNVKDAFERTASIVVNAFAKEVSSKIFEKIISFLDGILNENIKQIKKFDQNNGELIEKIKEIFSSSAFDKFNDHVGNKIGSLFKIKTNWGKLIKSFIDPVNLMRLSVYLMLLMASFILNFQHRKKAIDDLKPESEEYDKNCNDKKLEEICQRHKKDDKIIKMRAISLTEENVINKSYNERSKKFEFKMAICNVLDHTIKVADFIFDTKSLFKKGINTIMKCTDKSQNKEYLRISYSGFRKAFIQQVCFYSQLDFPSIMKFKGYTINKYKQYIYIDSKEKGTLEDLILSKKESLNQTNKLIIAYGISSAFEYLHQSKVIHRNLNPAIIYLDSNLYPYVSDFFKAIQTKTYTPYLLKQIQVEYMAPEFIKDFKSSQKLFGLDVYSFAMVLFFLFVEEIPFASYGQNIHWISEKVEFESLRPQFPDSFPVELNFWKELIIKCWNQDSSKRPKFDEISKEIESYGLNNEGIEKDLFRNYKENILQKT